VIRYLLKLRKNPAFVDDIDHLGNRRVRSVGELLENQFPHRPGPDGARDQGEDVGLPGNGDAMPHDLINAKPVMAAIREFFGSSQLSSSWTRPTRCRRSRTSGACRPSGPAPLARTRGLRGPRRPPDALRRICPIETPEGPTSPHLLAGVLRADQRVRLHRVAVPQGEGRQNRRLRGRHERRHEQAQDRRRRPAVRTSSRRRAETPRQEGHRVEPTPSTSPRGRRTSTSSPRRTCRWRDGRLVEDRVNARQAGNFILAQRDSVQYGRRVAQAARVGGASLIPFLEHDDANRA